MTRDLRSEREARNTNHKYFTTITRNLNFFITRPYFYPIKEMLQISYLHD